MLSFLQALAWVAKLILTWAPEGDRATLPCLLFPEAKELGWQSEGGAN